MQKSKTPISDYIESFDRDGDEPFIDGYEMME